MTGKTTPWVALGPQRFTDRRLRLTRDSGLVRQNVRSYRGALVRRGADGKAEYAHCNHAHLKPGVARRCAEREARKRNRLGDYWLEE